MPFFDFFKFKKKAAQEKEEKPVVASEVSQDKPEQETETKLPNLTGIYVGKLKIKLKEFFAKLRPLKNPQKIVILSPQAEESRRDARSFAALRMMKMKFFNGLKFAFKKKSSSISDEESQSPEEKEEAQKKKLVSLFMPKDFISKPVLITLIVIVVMIMLLFGVLPIFLPRFSEFVSISKITELIKGKHKEKLEELITPEEEKIEELATVRAYRVLRGDFIDILSGMGTVKGAREVELRFSVNGIVDSINFFEGDLLRKGDIIATLDQKDALLKLEYAKSKLKTQEVAQKSAEKKLEIHQKLFDEGVIIEPKLDEIKLEYEGAKTQIVSAKKEVEFALSELDKTYLYSPIDGVMGTRDVEVGEFVNTNVKIASLYDVSTIIVEMGIIEKDINRVALGQNAKAGVDTYPGVEFEGRIEGVAPIIEGKSRTLTVKIKIKNNNPKGTLLPGMFARVWISVYEKKNTIKVPASALYDLDNNGEFDSVYVIDEGNIARATPVKIGYISTDYIEIIEGLEEGGQIVTETMAELKDGIKVDVMEVQEEMF